MQAVARRLERIQRHVDGRAGASDMAVFSRGPRPDAGSVASSSDAAAFPSACQRAHFEKHGYCVVDDAVSPALLTALRSAARRVRDDVQRGTLHHGFIHRTPTGEPWGIRGVVSPQHNEPAFADYIGCPELTRYVQGFTSSKSLGLGSVTLFTNPRDDPFTIGWHRDSSTPGGTSTYGDADYCESAEHSAWRLERWSDRRPGSPRTPEGRGAVGFQLALLDSNAFEIVPGSHRRWRTAQELEAMSHYKGKYAEDSGPKFGLSKYSALPQMLAVPLKAGQTMFWDGDLIHRGAMLPEVERLTLHCSMGRRKKRNQGLVADPTSKTQFSDRRLMWRTHPDVRSMFSRQWQREAWDEWAADQLVPAGVKAWHKRTGPSCEQVDFADPKALMQLNKFPTKTALA